MKNLKKVIATIIALGMVSTMGVSTYADTIGDSQKTFYTGDVNLDGDVNGLDLLLLKKMLLGLVDMQQMYIDGDTLKKIEDEDVEPIIKNINADFQEYNSTTKELSVVYYDIINYDIAEEQYITLKITDDTIIYNIDDIENIANIPLNYLKIEYDENTNKILTLENITYNQKKCAIYIYPEKSSTLDIYLKNTDGIECSPAYQDGWHLTIEPNGSIYDKQGNEYPYISLDGEQPIKYNFSNGFVIKGEDTSQFLNEKLSYMGLNQKEIDGFIDCWASVMENNKYNLINFQCSNSNEDCSIDVSNTLYGEPNTFIVCMTYKPIDSYIEIEEQNLPTFERTGFSVVEWGGTEIK